MSDERASAARRTGKKAVAVTEAGKSKTPTTAAMTPSTTSRRPSAILRRISYRFPPSWSEGPARARLEQANRQE